MSVTFYGTTIEGTRVSIPPEHPRFLNLANGNACKFLLFLGLGDALCGEVRLPEARRAIIRTRASFDRRVHAFTRDSSDFKRPGKARVLTRGIDQEYFERRLDDFERFIDFLAESGAIGVQWA